MDTQTVTSAASRTIMSAENGHPAVDSSPDVAMEVARARQAQVAWAGRPLAERIAVLRRARYLIPARYPEFCQLVHPHRRTALETLVAEVLPTADAFRYLEQDAARILKPRRLGGKFRPLWLPGVKAEIRREAFGVILIIGPSNYPLFLPGVQAIQALVAGNAVVIKPGTGGGPVIQAFAQMLYDAGLDRDLLRILPELPEAGQRAIEAGVDKVLLTGSARTGVALLQQLAPRLIPAALELSGYDAAFVRADADLDRAVRAFKFALRLNHSETCISPRRIFVDERVAPELEKRLAAAVQQMPSYESRTPAARTAVNLINDALKHGARLAAGSVLPDQQGITPAVVAGVTPDMAILREEIFAPVVTIMPVKSDAEALQIAATCPYGLGASVFTKDTDAEDLIGRIYAGGVTVNDAVVPTADPRLPFGGRGRSGYGVTRGGEGLLEVTTVKVVTVQRSNMLWHLDQPQESDGPLFEAYVRATNTESFGGRMSAWLSLVRHLIARIWRSGLH